MNIKKFAELSEFSPDTLKYYEKIGLFVNIKETLEDIEITQKKN